MPLLTPLAAIKVGQFILELSAILANLFFDAIVLGNLKMV
jgi:hypothetical protein